MNSRKTFTESDYHAALQHTLQRSLAVTAKVGCGYKEITPKTHNVIIQTLERKSARKLIVVPRGCFKSSLCSVAYPIWLLNRNPNLRVLITSELYTNSKNFVREIRNHLERGMLRTVFGDYHSNVWNEGEIVIAQRTKTLKEASVTAGGMGTIKVGQHYDVVIMDDVSSHDNVKTPELAQKVIDYYRYMQSILEPHGEMVIVGTRYAANDLYGHILDGLGLDADTIAEEN